MAENTVTVFISPDAQQEMEDLEELRTGQVETVEWVGSINGQEVPLRLRLAEEGT